MSCYGGSHTWSWAATSSAQRPSPPDHCCCGQFTLVDLERWTKAAERRPEGPSTASGAGAPDGKAEA